MTEFSMLWETQTGTGDGSSSYAQDQANIFFRRFGNYDPTKLGVRYNPDLSNLAVSGSSSPLSVATGVADTYGFRYWNLSLAVNVAVSTPAVGDTGGMVVLRATWATNTVRAAIITNTDGNPAIPTVTQTAGTTWEIPLASFVIDTSGNIWTDSGKTIAGVTDLRQFIDDVRVIARQGGNSLNWADAGTTDYTDFEGGPVVMQAGVENTTPGGGSATASLTITFPEAFLYTPVVLITDQSLNSNPTYVLAVSVTTADFGVTWELISGTFTGAETLIVSWLAIGLRA